MDKSIRKKRIYSKKRKSRKKKIYQLGGGNVNVTLTLRNSELHYTNIDGSVRGFFDLSNGFNHAVLTESINKLKFVSQVHHGESPSYPGMGVLTTTLPAMDLVKQINRGDRATRRAHPHRSNAGTGVNMTVNAIFEMITRANKDAVLQLLKSNHYLIIHTSLYSQEVAFVLKTLYPHNKVSIQVAGNALRPGGICGKMDGGGLTYQNLICPRHYKTQEESIIDSLLHAFIIMNDIDPDTFNEIMHDYFRNLLGTKANLNNISPQEVQISIKNFYYGGNVGRPWGAVHPGESLSYDPKNRDYPDFWRKCKMLLTGRNGQLLDPGFVGGGGESEDVLSALNNKRAALSIQGPDFTEPFPKSPSAAVMAKYAQKYNFAYTLKDMPIALSANRYLEEDISSRENSLSVADVVFVYGPNAFSNSAEGVKGARTRTRITYNDVEDPSTGSYSLSPQYPIFRECVKMVFKATLKSMLDRKIDFPILCYVSGGIYGGYGEHAQMPTGIKIREETPEIIETAYRELKGDGSITHEFKRIFLCDSDIAGGRLFV